MPDFLSKNSRLHLEIITTTIITVSSVVPRGTPALSPLLYYQLQCLSCSSTFSCFCITSQSKFTQSQTSRNSCCHRNTYFHPLLPSKRARICFVVLECSDSSTRGKDCCAVGLAASISVKWPLMAVRSGLLSLIKISWRFFEVYDVGSCFSAVFIAVSILAFGGKFEATAAGAGIVFSCWTSFLFYHLAEQTPGPEKTCWICCRPGEKAHSLPFLPEKPFIWRLHWNNNGNWRL